MSVQVLVRKTKASTYPECRGLICGGAGRFLYIPPDWRIDHREVLPHLDISSLGAKAWLCVAPKLLAILVATSLWITLRGTGMWRPFQQFSDLVIWWWLYLFTTSLQAVPPQISLSFQSDRSSGVWRYRRPWSEC